MLQKRWVMQRVFGPRNNDDSKHQSKRTVNHTDDALIVAA